MGSAPGLSEALQRQNGGKLFRSRRHNCAGNGQFRDDRLGGDSFGVTRYIGPYRGLKDKYDYFCCSWLSESAYSLLAQPAFNNYLNDPDSAPPENWETDIYVPVERERRS